MGIFKSIQGGIKSEYYVSNAVDYCVGSNDFSATSENYLSNSLSYVTRSDKSIFASYVNCTSDDIQTQFKLTRQSYNKDSGILCHHFVQSFSPEDNVTPKQAHEIAMKLVGEKFKGYQAIVSTHIDTNHIHSHILVNSVNMETGEKWHDNQTTLKELKAKNDELCKEYGFAIVEPKNKKGLKFGSYAVVNKGVSWKQDMAIACKWCLENAKSKGDFISKLESKGYNVNWSDCNITLTNSDGKKARVDTLAKQFGKELTKENIEIALTGKSETTQKRREWHERLKAEKQNKKANMPKSKIQETAERYSNFTFGQNTDYRPQKYKPLNHTPQYSTSNIANVGRVLSAVTMPKMSPYKIGLKIFGYFLLKKYRNQAKQQRRIARQELYRKQLKYIAPNKLPNRTVGNVTYNELLAIQGNNYSLNVSTEKLKNLINIPFCYSAILRPNGTALLTCKEQDKLYILKLLKLEEELTPAPYGYEVYKQMKARGAEIGYYKLTEKQFNELAEKKFEMSVYKKDENGRIIITYDLKNKDVLDELTRFKFYGTQYSEMKRLASETGEKLKFVQIDFDEFNELKKCRNEVKFSAFLKEETQKYNVAYFEKDTKQIFNAINGVKRNTGQVL